MLLELALLDLVDGVRLKIWKLVKNLVQIKTLKMFQAQAFFQSSEPNFLSLLLNELLFDVDLGLEVES